MTAPSIRELEERLAAARRDLDRAQTALRGMHEGDEWEDYRSSLRAQLSAERDLALARGEPTCTPLPWSPTWSPGASSPHVVSSGWKTFVAYLVDDADPAWDGTTARMIDPSAAAVERLGIVEFKRCYGHRFGGPNDEVWSGHPLYGRGLEPYRAHVIVNSPWIAAERKVASVHPQFRSERWERLRHYFLLFHDQVFECLAESHECEVHEASFRDVLGILATRVLAAD